jgi:hypothetical protein
MARSSKVPPHALRLSSYGELEAYVRAFAAGHLHLLLLFGPPGVGKSRAVRQALDPQVGWISGQATPLGIYLQAFAYRHQPLVLDDIDGLYADCSGIRLLKALCQTEPVKTLGWHTLMPILELYEVPTQFSTTSRLALIGNDWKTLNADVAALEDRGHVLFFEPTALEVHRQAAGWFWDRRRRRLPGHTLPLRPQAPAPLTNKTAEPRFGVAGELQAEQGSPCHRHSCMSRCCV